MYWVYCNACGAVPGARIKEEHFVISNCCHIFCSNCSKAVYATSKCLSCKNTCSAESLNSAKRDPDRNVYFKDVTNTLQKLMEQVKFRQIQYKELIKNHEVMTYEYQRSKLRACRLQDEIAILEREVQVFEILLKKKLETFSLNVSVAKSSDQSISTGKQQQPEYESALRLPSVVNLGINRGGTQIKEPIPSRAFSNSLVTDISSATRTSIIE